MGVRILPGAPISHHHWDTASALFFGKRLGKYNAGRMGQVAKSMRQGLETKPFNTRLMAKLFGGIFDEGVYR